ncbi:MAG: metallophosphoesterase [Nitrososphaerales archaeon]
MNLLAITDIHGRNQVLKWLIKLAKDFELLVIAGDVTDWGDKDFFINFYKTLSDNNIITFFVPGNHDPYNKLTFPKITDLHGELRTFNSLIFCGIGGSNPTPFNTPFELKDEQAIDLLSKFSNRIDVLISHASPFGTKCDLTYKGNHIGSKPVRSFIEKVKPKFVISGHVHEARGMDVLGETLIINPGPAMNGFYAIISINGKPKVDLLQL